MEINIRIHSIKQLPVDITKKYPKGKIEIVAELNNAKKLVEGKTYGSVVKPNEVLNSAIYSTIHELIFFTKGYLA